MTDLPKSASSEHIRDRVCRLCLEECSKLAHLENLYFDETCFLDIIRECFQLEINVAQDHLPLWICRKCVTMSLNFYTFKNAIFENEVFLQNVNLDEIDNKLKNSPNRANGEWQQSNQKIKRVCTNETTKVESLIQFYDKDNKKNKIINASKSKKDFEKSDERIVNDTASNAESGIASSICSSLCNQLNTSDIFGKTRGANHCMSEKKYEKRYVCMTCKMQFSTPNDWKQHTILHYSTHKYPCLQCNDSFDSKHELVVHNYTHLYKENGEKLNKQQLMTRVKHKLQDKS